MLGNLKILEIASGMARHAATRQSVVAENIAHADTPGYKAKDVEAFSDAYSRMTRSNAADKTDLATFKTFESTNYTSVSPNGNTVSLEEQLAKSAQSSRDHQTAVTIYTKTLDMLRTSLGRR